MISYASLYKIAKRLLVTTAGWRVTFVRPILRALDRRLFAPRAIKNTPNPLKWKGLALHWDEDTWWPIRMLLAGDYEPHVMRTVSELVRPGDGVVNVGAHLGIYSTLIAQLVGPRGKVWAFEPDPRVYPLLVRNIKANYFDNIVQPYPVAIGDRIGTERLFLSKASGYSSFFKPWAGQGQVLEVPCLTLDSFLESQGWPTVSLVLMDIEGGEYRALSGMRQTILRNHSIIRVLFEFCIDILDKAGVTVAHFYNLLLDMGLSYIYLIDVKGRVTIETSRQLERLSARKKFDVPHILASGQAFESSND